MMALMCLWSVRVATCKIQNKGILEAIIAVPCPVDIVHTGNARDKGGEKLWGDRGDVGAKQTDLD